MNNGNHGKPRKVIGKPFRKVDARAKCNGQTRFADDISLPRMLYCKLLRSPVPHALIKRIDATRARQLPGVVAVITGGDLPVPYGILPVSQDEHALCIDKVRFIGDPVAAVAAVDEDVAFEAMNLIEVEYEKLQTIEASLNLWLRRVSEGMARALESPASDLSESGAFSPPRWPYPLRESRPRGPSPRRHPSLPSRFHRRRV